MMRQSMYGREPYESVRLLTELCLTVPTSKFLETATNIPYIDRAWGSDSRSLVLKEFNVVGPLIVLGFIGPTHSLCWRSLRRLY